MPGDQSNVGLAMQGFGALAQGAQQYAADPRNRKLSPAQKWIAKMLAGELTPDEAAIATQLEMQRGQGAPSAPQGPVPRTSGAPAQFAGAAPGSEGGLSSQAMQMAAQQPRPMPAGPGLGARIQQTTPARPQQGLSAAPEFETEADLATLMQAQKPAASSRVADNRLEIARLNASTRTNIESNKEEGRNARADARNTQRKEQFDAKIQLDREKFGVQKQQFGEKLAQMKREAKARGNNSIAASRIASAQRDLANMRQALLRLTLDPMAMAVPEAKAQAEQMQAEIDAAESVFDQFLFEMESNPKGRPQVQKPAPAQGQPQQAPAPSAADMVKKLFGG